MATSKDNTFVCSFCDPPRKCVNAQGLAAHQRSAHPDQVKSKSTPKKTHHKTYHKKSSEISLADAINALEIKRDALDEVIKNLKEML